MVADAARIVNIDSRLTAAPVLLIDGRSLELCVVHRASAVAQASWDITVQQWINDTHLDSPSPQCQSVLLDTDLTLIA